MKKSEDLKKIVKDKYASIVTEDSGCGCGCSCSTEDSIENSVFSESYDVVISNCVINLVPDKEKAFSEIMRVLKPGGHFCISDVALNGTLPLELQSAAELYAGCVAGALQIKDYLNIIDKAGFEEVRIKKNKPLEVPDSMLLDYISAEQLSMYKNSGSGIFSITVVGKKQE